MMREVNKCQNKCKLDSSREPLVRPIIRSVSRKITKLGTSFEKFSPKGSKYLSKKKRESTRLIERRKSTLQPSTSRCSKIRKVINFIFLAFDYIGSGAKVNYKAHSAPDRILRRWINSFDRGHFFRTNVCGPKIISCYIFHFNLLYRIFITT